MTDIDGSNKDSFAEGINDLGDVVGYTDDFGFLYANGKMIDLNTLIDPSLGVILMKGRGYQRLRSNCG